MVNKIGYDFYIHDPPLVFIFYDKKIAKAQVSDPSNDFATERYDDSDLYDSLVQHKES